MAELASKSSTKSVVWDYFGLEVEADGNPSTMAVLFVRVVKSERW